MRARAVPRRARLGPFGGALSAALSCLRRAQIQSGGSNEDEDGSELRCVKGPLRQVVCLSEENARNAKGNVSGGDRRGLKRNAMSAHNASLCNAIDVCRDICHPR